MNRLAAATSPYLLQHKDNPVAWWEWGPDALAEARATGRPILLSVGYAACHWCHVMAHESFEDPAIAALMNELFVNIKVDREERPDVDHLYMSALHALGQQGGWPLTMFLDGEARPFWGGTYFPPEQRFGRPSFAHILRSIAAIYRDDPDKIARNGEALASHLGRVTTDDLSVSLDTGAVAAIADAAAGAIDPVHGGLRGAPKFPNPTILELLARRARHQPGGAAERLFLLTLDRMARGGIQDHLGGGFARYSVDERWLVPHFEKMLYDNAQLLELYAVGWAMSGRSRFRDAADGIVAWLRREMTVPEGAYASSLDADSEGEEGRFYVWSLAEMREALGARADAFAAAYDVTEAGNFEGHVIPNRLAAEGDDEGTFSQDRARLLEHRAGRVRPGLDDKVLADWNGLMAGALVRAGLVFGHSDWIDEASRVVDVIAGRMIRDDVLAHSWRGGSVVSPGFALDEATLMRAALALYEARGEARHLDLALGCRRRLLARYLDPETGLLAMTAEGAETLVARPRPVNDDAVPNANGVFAEALVRLAQITGAPDDHALAEAFLEKAGSAAAVAPLGHASILNALDQHLSGVAVTIVADPERRLTEAALARSHLGRSVAVTADAGRLPASHPAHALAAAAVGPTALICAGMTCGLPITDPETLASELARAAAGPGRVQSGAPMI